MKNVNPTILTKVVFAVVAALLFIFFVVFKPGEGLQAVQTSSAVQIPAVLYRVFEAFLFSLLTAGFAWLLQVIGLDLTGYAGPLAGTLSIFLMGLAQNWINILPSQYDPAVQLILNLLVIIFGGAGALYFVALARGRKSLLS